MYDVIHLLVYVLIIIVLVLAIMWAIKNFRT